ncbi:MAG: hypothetical protein AAGF32_10680 [Pseudomonadota bacterium]
MSDVARAQPTLNAERCAALANVRGALDARDDRLAALSRKNAELKLSSRQVCLQNYTLLKDAAAEIRKETPDQRRQDALRRLRESALKGRAARLAEQKQASAYMLEELRKAGRCLSFQELSKRYPGRSNATMIVVSFKLARAGKLTRARRDQTLLYGLPAFGPCK